MRRNVASKVFLPMLALALCAMAGCQHAPDSRPFREPPPKDIPTTTLDYLDTEAFDVLFETALVKQDPVFVIRTGHDKPDWEGRLNAWIAAWNRGGKAEAGGERKARGQVPLPGLAVDGDSLREFRLLVESLMDRVDGLARAGSAWYIEERVRGRRIALLRPYNLHFHIADDHTIQLIFFNGKYAGQYRDVMPHADDVVGEDAPHGRQRGFTCSRCKEAAQLHPQVTLSFE